MGPLARHERLARIYDEEIYPLVGRRLADLALGAASFPTAASVLEVGCATGAVTVEIVQRLDSESRLIALEASAPLLGLARARVAGVHAGRRVYFRAHAPAAKLPFGDETFDTVLASITWADLPDPAATISDLARVTKPGGQLVVTTPLRDSWSAFLDIYQEVLQRRDDRAGLQALASYLVAMPQAETVASLLEAEGLAQVQIDLAHWELLFRSAREFFFAPVIEHGPLARWKGIAGKGPDMQEVFLAIKEAIDTYFSGRAFAIGIHGGGFSARKTHRVSGT